jgi:hypothetical protein
MKDVAILKFGVSKRGKFEISPSAELVTLAIGFVTDETKMFSMPNRYSKVVRTIKRGQAIMLIAVDDECLFYDSYTKEMFYAAEYADAGGLRRGFVLCDRVL